MKTQDWDAIVIGSGVGALTAATILAQANRRVLVLERLGNFGGAATTFRHGELTVEASLHETDGDTVLARHGVFARLGLQGAVDPIETDNFYEVRAPGLVQALQMPHGLAAARAVMKQTFPGREQTLDRYFDEIERLHRTLADFEQFSARGPMALLGLVFSGRLFEFVSEAQRTLGEEFDRVFADDEALKFALGAPLAYFDDDPNRLSFVLYGGVWSRYVQSGAYYVRGGSTAITLALAQQVKRHGGVLRRKTEVVRLLLDEDGSVCGVAARDEAGREERLYAKTVISGAAPANLAAMLPEPARASFAEPYKDFEPSISLFSVALGLTAPAAAFGVSSYSTFVFPETMARFADFPKAAAVFSRPPAGDMPPYVIADYGRLETGLGRDGDLHGLVVCGVDRFDWWRDLDEAAERERRAAWIEAVIDDLERRFPGLAGAVAQCEMANARTMRHRLGTPQGEVYGFRPTPNRLFGRLPTAATSVNGLWLASAYTVSGGYAGAMSGGAMAADAVLRASR